MGAIGVHHTATVDEPWDGPAAVAAMPSDAAVLRYCHAWVDSAADPDLKGSYKFPHHQAAGGPANMAAVRNGLARLSQAGIPSGDDAGVRAHLEAHMEDAMARQQDRLKTARPRAALVEGRTDWFRITNLAEMAEVYIYDEVGFWGVTASDFVAQLNKVKTSKIACHVNSPGGEVFDGIAIYNALKNHPAEVTVYVDSLAASAASVIAMAGDRIVMGEGAQMMIHDAHGMCLGNGGDMSTMAALLERQSDNIAGFYARRAGGTKADWRARMQAETWYSADEAVAAGLADEVATFQPGDSRGVVRAEWDLSIFRYGGRLAAPAPTAILAQAANVPPPTATVPTADAGELEWDDSFADALRAAMRNEPDDDVVATLRAAFGPPPPPEPEYIIDPVEFLNAVLEGTK